MINQTIKEAIHKYSDELTEFAESFIVNLNYHGKNSIHLLLYQNILID